MAGVARVAPARDAVAGGRRAKLHDLELRHEALPRHRQPEHSPKVVVVHEYMDGGVEEQAAKLQCLHVCQPAPRHQEHDGVMIHVQKEVGRWSTLEKLQHSVEQLVRGNRTNAG